MVQNWRDYLLNDEQVDEAEEAYVVFEEDPKGNKYYDLTIAVFSDLEIAKAYAEDARRDEDVFVANYKDYISGCYSHLASFCKA